jgi:CRP/FNR family transcriptional regulator, cyclic AMP receptor protein
MAANIDRQGLLAKIEVLQGLTPADYAALAAKCRWRFYPKGQQIIEQNSGSQDVFLVAQGKVRATIYAVNGREVTFRDLTDGASFGELSAVDGQTRSTSVVAMADTWLASISRDQFKQILRAHPVVVDNVLNRLVGLVRNLTDRIVEYSTLGVRNRIQAELLRMAREKGVKANKASITPSPKHADIASRVSTNREEVTREFGHLAREKILERRRGELAILDVQRLADMVDRVRES